MTKRTIKRLRNNINRHNRRVRHENTVFEKMTKAEKRVRLAKDASSKARCSEEDHAARGDVAVTGRTPRQPIGRARRRRRHAAEKNSCRRTRGVPRVRGGVLALLHLVMRVNVLRVGQIRTAEKKPGVEIRDFEKIKKYLGAYFSENQLDLMEAAFRAEERAAQAARPNEGRSLRLDGCS